MCSQAILLGRISGEAAGFQLQSSHPHCVPQKELVANRPISPRAKATTRVGRWSLLGRYHRLPRRLDHDYVLTEKVLGKGSNGSVVLAKGRHQLSKRQRFAVKSFNLKRLREKARRNFEQEVEIFLCMDHPHIARLCNVYEAEDTVCLVMECMDGGELFDRVTAKGRYKEPDAAAATRQMLLAVNYLHSLGIAHRDLKLENFVYDDRDNLKLIDFGFSRFRDRDARLMTACGTLAYVAPEVLSKVGYTYQCDMWSLGVIVYTLLSGQMPFGGGTDNEQKQQILSGHIPMSVRRWASTSAEAKDFAKALLLPDPDRRLTSQQALKHPFIMRYSDLWAPTRCLDSSVLNALREYCKASVMKRICLVAIAWQLPSVETAELRELFLTLDKDADGTISFNELCKSVGDRFELSEAELQNMFDAMDRNRDQEIQYTEFLAATMSTASEEVTQATFRNFDVDVCGFITEADLHEVAGGGFFEGHSVQALLAEFETAEAGKVSLSEFKAFVLGPPKKDIPFASATTEAPSSHVLSLSASSMDSLWDESPLDKAKPSCCATM